MANDDFVATMEYIVAALEEKGYDSYAQLIGYVTAKDSDYITRYKEARKLIESLDFKMVRNYVQNMKPGDSDRKI